MAMLLDMGRAPRAVEGDSLAEFAGLGYAWRRADARRAFGPAFGRLLGGAVLFECLTGQLLPASGARDALRNALAQARAPGPVAEVVLSALLPRAERAQSMVALLRALRMTAAAGADLPTIPPAARRRTPRAPFVTPSPSPRAGSPLRRASAKTSRKGACWCWGEWTSAQTTERSFTSPCRAADGL